jgi:hypothetical protein
MNIPSTPLDAAKKILLVGVGGGFDVFTGLPFVYHWPDKEFVLTNFSSKISPDFLLRNSTDEDYPQGTLTGIPNVAANCTLGLHGAKALSGAFKKIIERYEIDCILGVDGGVDSLSRGDEVDHGTVLEDSITLAALDGIDLPKVLCCAGFGCETEENLNHYRVLENMAKLASYGSFYGSFSLTNNMSEFFLYLNTCEQAWENGKRKSHIQTKIISAVTGRFGGNNVYSDVDARVAESTGRVFISPLSSIFWMYDLDIVIRENLLVPYLKKGTTFVDSKILLRQFMEEHKERRSHLVLPL